MKLKEYLKTLIKNKYFQTIAKGIGSLALLTAICAISVHYLTGDTLSEYAEKNPETAYRNVEDIPTSGSNTADDISIAESNTVEDVSINEPNADEDISIAEPNTLEEGSANNNDDSTDSTPQDDTTDISYTNSHISNMIHFYDLDGGSSERVIYEDGFYYEPLTDEMITYITGTSLPEDSSNLAISVNDLRYLGIKYVDFDGLTQVGEIICNKKIVDDLISIFYELYCADYQFEKIVLIDNYGGDDTASMCANNTSCFNYRVVDNSSSLSNHAYGLAIDINPFYNPYIVFGAGPDGTDYISPSGSEIYADRSASFPYKIDESDLCYKLFKEHGFTWGGNWNSCKDYQHFQKK